jgi:hypothetical protein
MCIRSSPLVPDTRSSPLVPDTLTPMQVLFTGQPMPAGNQKRQVVGRPGGPCTATTVRRLPEEYCPRAGPSRAPVPARSRATRALSLSCAATTFSQPAYLNTHRELTASCFPTGLQLQSCGSRHTHRPSIISDTLPQFVRNLRFAATKIGISPQIVAVRPVIEIHSSGAPMPYPAFSALRGRIATVQTPPAPHIGRLSDREGKFLALLLVQKRFFCF